MRLGDRQGVQPWQRAGLNAEGAQLAEPLNLDHGSAAFGRRKHCKLHQSAVPAAIPGRAQHQAITPRREAHALVLRQRVTTMVSKVQGVSSTTPCGLPRVCLSHAPELFDGCWGQATRHVDRPGAAVDKPLVTAAHPPGDEVLYVLTPPHVDQEPSLAGGLGAVATGAYEVAQADSRVCQPQTEPRQVNKGSPPRHVAGFIRRFGRRRQQPTV